jgi:hypothetical protein
MLVFLYKQGNSFINNLLEFFPRTLPLTWSQNPCLAMAGLSIRMCYVCFMLIMLPAVLLAEESASQDPDHPSRAAHDPAEAQRLASEQAAKLVAER